MPVHVGANTEILLAVTYRTALLLVNTPKIEDFLNQRCCQSQGLNP